MKIVNFPHFNKKLYCAGRLLQKYKILLLLNNKSCKNSSNIAHFAYFNKIIIWFLEYHASAINSGKNSSALHKPALAAPAAHIDSCRVTAADLDHCRVTAVAGLYLGNI